MLIQLRTNQYDPFIDFLKGICILFVVLTHCLPLQDNILFSLWGDQAVPLFLLIQVFHAYKKGNIDIVHYYNFKKLFHRILLPFIILLVIQIFLVCFFSKKDLLSILKSTILAGGIGPGSYYVWIYLQCFVLLPIFMFVINKIKHKYLSVLFIATSILIEIICSYSNIPSWLYRLLFIRYFFLIYLGYKWAMDGGVKIDKRTILLSIISIFFILIFQYTDLNMEPIFYQNDWKIFHWISYFYVAYLFVYVLHKCYKKLKVGKEIFICKMGKYSYEIYLVQMFIFTFYPTNMMKSLIGSDYLAALIRILATTFLSIIPVLVYKKYFSK